MRFSEKLREGDKVMIRLAIFGSLLLWLGHWLNTNGYEWPVVLATGFLGGYMLVTPVSYLLLWALAGKSWRDQDSEG